jgi:two-component system response regulator DesR
VIKVLIAEDQAMMRGAMSVLLDLEEDLTVVAQVASVDQIVPAAIRARPDIALLDIELGGAHGSPDGQRDGIDAARELTATMPSCRVVIVTTFGRPGYLRRAMEAGAKGFLVKDGPVEGLAQAIRTVHDGGTVVDPGLAAAALSVGPSPLTDRERGVLQAAHDGATVADIAARLHLSESTVRNHLSSVIGKTGTRNRAEAGAVARRNGWL